MYRLVNNPANIDGVPGDLRPLVGHCLAKDPADRPSADQLLAALGAIQPAPGWLAESIMNSFAQTQSALWTALAVGGELVAGALFVLGFATPLAALLVLGTMAVAIAKVHGPKGFFIQNGGYEYNLVLMIAALAVVALGPGAFSLDHVLGLAR